MESIDLKMTPQKRDQRNNHAKTHQVNQDDEKNDFQTKRGFFMRQGMIYKTPKIKPLKLLVQKYVGKIEVG